MIDLLEKHFEVTKWKLLKLPPMYLDLAFSVGSRMKRISQTRYCVKFNKSQGV